MSIKPDLISENPDPMPSIPQFVHQNSSNTAFGIQNEGALLGLSIALTQGTARKFPELIIIFEQRQ